LISAQQRSIICDGENLITGFLGTFPLTPVTNPGPAPLVFIDPVTGQPYNQAFFQLLRRNVEGGPRQDDLQHTEYRGIVGMRGELDQTWSYDLYYQYGRTNFAETYRNEFSAARLARALDVVDNPAIPGIQPICRSAQPGAPNADPNCVPFDIFATGQVSPAAVNYINVSGFTRGVVEETVANASITGELGGYGLKFPWSESGVGVALGVEYRKEQLNFVSDLEFSTGDLTGQGAATLPVSGSFDVREAFAEVRIPIVEHNFIEELTLTGGYRYSDYQIGGSGGGGFNTDTYKLQLEFAPVRDIRFRGGYNRAVRAPNIQELFAPQRVALDGATDPCSGRVLTAADTGCLVQGLRVGQRVAPNPAQQYNGLIGGSRTLSPEIVDTWTAGVVIQPRFIPGLAVSVDYFDIKVDNTIGTIGADTILATCISTRDPGLCGLIHRNPVSGSIWLSPDGYVQDLTQNIGSLRTKGIDINASYNHRIGGLGSLGLSFVGTYLIDLITNTGVSVPYDCVGFYGNVCSAGVTSGSPNPEWRHQARITWNAPDGIGVSLRWRYFGSVQQDQASDNVNLHGNTTPQNARIPAQNFFDLALSFRLNEHYSFRLGANNLLDREPPLVGSARSGTFGGGACPAGSCNGNTYAQAYDALGRYIYAGVTLDF
jgi:outer membrane receptor protein involved in Fe transport